MRSQRDAHTFLFPFVFFWRIGKAVCWAMGVWVGAKQSRDNGKEGRKGR